MPALGASDRPAPYGSAPTAPRVEEELLSRARRRSGSERSEGGPAPADIQRQWAERTGGFEHAEDARRRLNPPDPRDLREQALGTNDVATRIEWLRPLLTPQEDEPERPQRMSQREYDQLGERQRAAVDFNTALVRAVRKDRRLQDEYKPSDAQRETYDQTVEQMFGKDRGSETFAPETMALLKQLDFRDTAADLDDFLDLRVAVSEEDLPYLRKKATLPRPGDTADAAERGEKLELSRALADKTADLERALSKTSQLLQTIQASAAVDRNPDVLALGGQANEPKPMPGFAPMGQGDDENTYFRSAMHSLALASNKDQEDELLSQVFADLEAAGGTQKFLRFADAATRNAERFGVRLGLSDAEERDPAEVRKLLGL